MEELRKSTLVTAVAIILIVSASVVTLLSGGAFALFHMVQTVDGKELSTVAAEAAESGEFGPYVGFTLRHVELIVVSCFVLSALWLAVSVGLLRRKDWARIGSIIFMLVIVLLSICGMIFFPVLAGSIPATQGSADLSSPDSTNSPVAVYNIVHTLAICVLCAGIAWKLRTEAIVKEFA